MINDFIVDLKYFFILKFPIIHLIDFKQQQKNDG